MKGKNILVTAVCVVGLGGLVANTVVGISNNNKLKDEISQLRTDLEAADAAQKEELIKMLTTTRDAIKAAYEAADAALVEGLYAVQAQLEDADDQIVADMDAADLALLQSVYQAITSVSAEIQNLSADMASGDDDLSAKIDVVDQKIENLIATIGQISTSYEALKADLLDAVNQLSAATGTIESTVATVGSLNTVYQALAANVENNYYTKGQVDTLLTQIDAMADTLADMFRDNAGNIVTMADLIEQVEDLFEEVNQKIADNAADIVLNQQAIADLQDAFADANARMDAFCGPTAAAKKAELVNQLRDYYLKFKTEVIGQKKIDVMAANGGVMPAAYQTLFDQLDDAYVNILDPICFEGVAAILMAADQTAAEAQLQEYELRMMAYMYQITFMVDKQVALSNIASYVTTDCPVNFTAAVVQPYYEDQINAINFEVTQIEGKTATECAQYYQGLKDSLDAIDGEAKDYHDLVVGLKAADEALAVYEGTGHYMTSAQVDYYQNLNDTACDFNTFKANPTDLDAVKAATFDVNEDLAAKYDLIVKAHNDANDLLETLKIAAGEKLTDAEVAYYTAKNDEAIDFTAYNANPTTYDVLQAEVFDINQTLASGFNDIKAARDEANAALDAHLNSNPNHYMTSAQIDYLKSLNDNQVDFDTYKVITDPANAPVAADVKANYFDATEYAANEYCGLFKNAEDAKAVVDGLVTSGEMSVADADELKAIYDEIVKWDDYKANYDTLDAGTAYDAKETGVDTYVADSNTAIANASRLVNAYKTITNYRLDVKADIAALTYVVGDSEDVIFDNYLDGMINLSIVKAATASYASDAEFNAYVDSVKAGMDNVYSVAENEDDILEAYYTDQTTIGGYDPAKYQTTYFNGVLDAAKANYSVIAAGALKAEYATPDQDATVALADAANAGAAADFGTVVDGLATFKASYDKGVTVNGLIDAYRTAFIDVLKAVCHNTHANTYGPGDEYAVLHDFDAQITALEATWKYEYNVHNFDAVPTIGATDTYDATLLAFNTYIAALESVDTIGARYENTTVGVVDSFKEALNALIPQMKDAFKVYEAAYCDELIKAAIGDNKDGLGGSLKADYDLAVAACGTDSDKLAQLAAAWDLYIIQIGACEVSGDIPTMIANCRQQFSDISGYIY